MVLLILLSLISTSFAQCNYKCYSHSEELNPNGPNTCDTDCDCLSVRTCSIAGYCQGNSTFYDPPSCVTTAVPTSSTTNPTTSYPTTLNPTPAPTFNPSDSPTIEPTILPTENPTFQPTPRPTLAVKIYEPTFAPSSIISTESTDVSQYQTNVTILFLNQSSERTAMATEFVLLVIIIPIFIFICAVILVVYKQYKRNKLSKLVDDIGNHYVQLLETDEQVDNKYKTSDGIDDINNNKLGKHTDIIKAVNRTAGTENDKQLIDSVHETIGNGIETPDEGIDILNENSANESESNEELYGATIGFDDETQQ